MSSEITIDPSVEKKINEINMFLDDYETNHGLPKLNNEKIPGCLSLSLDEIKRKSSGEITEYVFEINSYSLYLQRLINRNKALERWAKSKLDDLAGYFLPEVSPRYGFSERMLIAKTQPEVCQKLNKFLRKVTLELDRLYGIPEQIRILAESIKEFKFIALKKEKENG